ncbi:MAG: DMP19 family protein [Myxococcota bacterium]
MTEEGPPADRVRMTLGDAEIAAARYADEVIEPVWWSATVWDGPAAYEASLAPFTQEQRRLWAVAWYRAEVFNGGHHQFFGNPTGIVWRDAVEGLRAIGSPRMAEVLATASRRLGGASPLQLERLEALGALDARGEGFDDLDDRMYDLADAEDLEGLMLRYAQSRPAAFHFDGYVDRPGPGSPG